MAVTLYNIKSQHRQDTSSEATSLAKKLLATYGCWERNISFPSALKPFRGYPCSRRLFYKLVHRGSTKLTQQILKRVYGVRREYRG